MTKVEPRFKKGRGAPICNVQTTEFWPDLYIKKLIFWWANFQQEAKDTHPSLNPPLDNFDLISPKTMYCYKH